MGYKIGMPSLKLNGNDRRSKKCGSFGDVSKEALERIGRDPDIDPTRTHLNEIRGFKTTEELLEYSRKHIAEIEAKTGKKVRKDAVLMCATIIKPPASEMKHLPEAEQYRLLDIAIREFSGIVRYENVKTVAIHFDEQGPHAHIFWEPMTEDGRLCAKEMHNRSFFQSVNRIIPAALRKAGFDVENCEMYDLAEKEYDQERKKNFGRTSAQFKRDMEAEKKKLQSEISQARQELEEKQGELLKMEQVAEVKPKKVFLKKDTVEMPVKDFQNMRTTALKVAQVEDLIQGFDHFKGEINQEMEKTKDELEELKTQKKTLEIEIKPLEARAASARSIIDQANREADQIRLEARIKGEEQVRYDGYLAYGRIRDDANKEAKGIVRDAEKEAKQIRDEAKADAKEIIEKECQYAREAVTFYDEVMSVEGEGDFRRFRKNPSFWLDVETYMITEVPKMVRALEELKGIISFIPSYIVTRAKQFLKHFGHEREYDEPEVSAKEGHEHDRDGLDMEYYYTRSRSR